MKHSIDAGDVLLHVGLVVGAVILTKGSWIAAAGLVLFLFVREIWQDQRKGHRFPQIWPLRRSSQKDAEFLVPALVACLLAFIL